MPEEAGRWGTSEKTWGTRRGDILVPLFAAVAFAGPRWGRSWADRRGDIPVPPGGAGVGKPPLLWDLLDEMDSPDPPLRRTVDVSVGPALWVHGAVVQPFDSVAGAGYDHPPFSGSGPGRRRNAGRNGHGETPRRRAQHGRCDGRPPNVPAGSGLCACSSVPWPPHGWPSACTHNWSDEPITGSEGRRGRRPSWRS